GRLRRPHGALCLRGAAPLSAHRPDPRRRGRGSLRQGGEAPRAGLPRRPGSRAGGGAGGSPGGGVPGGPVPGRRARLLVLRAQDGGEPPRAPPAVALPGGRGRRVRLVPGDRREDARPEDDRRRPPARDPADPPHRRGRRQPGPPRGPRGRVRGAGLRVDGAAGAALHGQRRHDRRGRRGPARGRRTGGSPAERPRRPPPRVATVQLSEYDRLLASLPDAVIGVRPDLTVFLWNAAAETLIGRPATRSVGRALADCLGPDARLVRHLGETLRLGESGAEAESEVMATDGRAVPVSLVTAPIHGPTGGTSSLRGAVAVLRDLSRLKALEAEVRRGERLAALGQMALALAHEIRNPLSAI